MATFLTGKELEDNIYDLIFKAQKKLLIVSPFIKLDDYFKTRVFDKHIVNSDIHITIVFGKNSKNPELSFNVKDFEYFKQFPNISVVYVPKLHAKYYANENVGIVTSLNLYDYSFKNNIEFGVLSTTNVLGVGLDRIDEQAWEESMKILRNGHAIFVRRPSFKKKLIGKDYLGSETKLDYTSELINNVDFPKVNVFKFTETEYVNPAEMKERMSREVHEKNEIKKPISSKPVNEVVKNYSTSSKTVSVSQLSKSTGIPAAKITRFMILKGYVSSDKITSLGKEKGLIMKNYMDKDYIAYPENLPELNEIKYSNS